MSFQSQPPDTTASSVRLLCTGDLHLGRHPSCVSPEARHLSIEAVWQRTIDCAIDQRVDALVLTGDVADDSNQYFESIGPLRRGIGQLVEAGIPVFAVAGNHDYHVLPRLAGGFPDDGFHFLGAGGTWESKELLRNGKPVCWITGWSFPESHVLESPLDTIRLPDTSLPVVVLLHGELDAAPGCRYGPLRRSDLGRHRVAAWLLGHIHRPDCHLLDNGLALYPGSLQPLDPGEERLHGPWIVEITPGGRAAARQVPVATLAYSSLDVDLTGIDDYDLFEQYIDSSILEHLETYAAEAPEIRQVVIRLRLTGRTSLHRQLDAVAGSLAQDLHPSFGNVECIIDRVVIETRPPYDLERLAERRTAPGVIARLIIELEEDEADQAPIRLEHRRLFEDLSRKLMEVHHAPAFQPLGDPHHPDQDLPYQRKILIRQARLLLDELLAQLDDVVAATAQEEVVA